MWVLFPIAQDNNDDPILDAWSFLSKVTSLKEGWLCLFLQAWWGYFPSNLWEITLLLTPNSNPKYYPKKAYGINALTEVCKLINDLFTATVYKYWLKSDNPAYKKELSHSGYLQSIGVITGGSKVQAIHKDNVRLSVRATAKAFSARSTIYYPHQLLNTQCTWICLKLIEESHQSFELSNAICDPITTPSFFW